jgi:tRNA pseudouridine13 synthase
MSDSAAKAHDDTVEALRALALDPPRAYAAPVLRGRIRVGPDDFQVVEQLGFTPDGEGEHWLVQVRKTGRNTDDVGKWLAGYAGVHPREVGFCGLKDRHAVTTQWFSLRQPRGTPAWGQAGSDGIEILDWQRHRRRLRRGSHRGNAFRIVLREIHGDRDRLAERLALIRARGVPNYFGLQRFGHHGDNLPRAWAMLHGGRRRPSRQQRGLNLSAARSALFNAVCAARVGDGTWERVLEGEEAMLDGSRSRFPVDGVDSDLEARAKDLDLHPTGPLWGRGERRVQGLAKSREDAALDPWRPWCEGLEHAGLEQDRRPLRMCVRELALEQSTPEAVTLGFVLGRGEYATAALREIVDFAGPE